MKPAPASTDGPANEPDNKLENRPANLVRRLPLVWRGLGWASAVALLLLTFSFYTNPEFMVKLANKSWSCF